MTSRILRHELVLRTSSSVERALCSRRLARKDEVFDRGLELARELAAGPQVAMRLLKRSIYNAADLSWEQALEEIAVRTPMADHHPDAREGVAAFREKRTPKFNRSLEEPDDAT